MTYISQLNVGQEKTITLNAKENIVSGEIIGRDVVNNAYVCNPNIEQNSIFRETVTSNTSLLLDVLQIKEDKFIFLRHESYKTDNPLKVTLGLYTIDDVNTIKNFELNVTKGDLGVDYISAAINSKYLIKTSDTTFLLVIFGLVGSVWRVLVQNFSIDYNANTISKDGTLYYGVVSKGPLVNSNAPNSENVTIIPKLADTSIIVSYINSYNSPSTQYIYKISLSSDLKSGTGITSIRSNSNTNYYGSNAYLRNIKDDIYLYSEVLNTNTVISNIVKIDLTLNTFTILQSSLSNIFNDIYFASNLLCILESDTLNTFYGCYSITGGAIKIIKFELVNNTLNLINSITSTNIYGLNSVISARYNIYYRNGSYYLPTPNGVINFKDGVLQEHKYMYNTIDKGYIIYPLNNNFWLGIYLTKESVSTTTNYSNYHKIKLCKLVGISIENKNLNENILVKYSGEYLLKELSIFGKDAKYFTDLNKTFILKNGILNNINSMYDTAFISSLYPLFYVDLSGNCILYDSSSTLFLNGTFVDKNSITHKVVDGRLLN